MNDLTPQDFCTIGEEILSKSGEVSGTFHFHQWWTSVFLVDPVIVAEVWNQLKLHEYEEEEWMRAATPEHLQWAIYYLKQYTTESKMADKC